MPNAASTSTFATIFNQAQHCFSGYDCQEFITLTPHHSYPIKWTDKINNRYYYAYNTVYFSPVVVKVPEKGDIQNRLLEQMYSTREARGDFTIQCHNKSFLVHKEILYCSGGYFQSIFETTGFNETNQLNLSDRSEEVMNQIIHFIYRGELINPNELTSTLLFEIYEASKYFQMKTLQELSQSTFISTLKTGFDYSIIDKVMRQENQQMRIALERAIEQLGGKRLLDAYDTHQSKRQKSCK